MALRHAILTALLEQPSSGLELTRRFDRSIGYFWSATHQQVYRELARLEADGRVRATPGPPARGNPRSYAVLPAGREELAAWVDQAEDPRALRDPLMLRVRAAGVVGIEGLLPELRRQLLGHRATLVDYRAIEQRDFAGPDLSQSQRLQHLVLQAGIGLEEHWVTWLEQALVDLDPVAADPPGGPVRDTPDTPDT